MNKAIRLKTEEEHFSIIYSLFDSAIRDLILGNLASSYEEQLLETIYSKYTPLKETPFGERLNRLLKDVLGKINVSGGIRLFIDYSSEIVYGRAYPTTDESTLNYIVLSKKLIESMNDNEVKFILGHEISHIAFDHGVIRWITQTIYPDPKKIPPYINNELKLWEQLAELSSDRAGLYSTEDLDSSINALKKLDNIKRPNLKTRVECLTSDKAVTRFCSNAVDNPQDNFSRDFSDFIEKACILLSKADGHISTEEETFILNRISRFKYVDNDYNIDIEGLNINKLIEDGKDLAKNYPEKVKEVFIYLGVLSLKDQRLTKEEYTILKEIGINSFGYTVKEIDTHLVSVIRSKFFIPYNEL